MADPVPTQPLNQPIPASTVVKSQPEIPVVTPEEQHQQMLKGLQQQLGDTTGQQTHLAPTTEDSSAEVTMAEDKPGDSIPQFYERAVLGRPGFEPSRSFLTKLMDRIRKKNPQAQVKLEEQK